MIRIAIADDHQIVIDGLRHMLTANPDIHIVGEATHGGELIALLLKHPAHIALVDIEMPVMNGIAACEKICADFPGTRVVALTMMNEPSVIRKMLEAGASGYLMKNTGKTELMQCITAVAAGKSYYSEEVAETIRKTSQDTSHSAQSAPFPTLSRREKNKSCA